jgi:hypothetical protein
MRHTIENWTSKEAQELGKLVLLLRSQLIPPRDLPPALNLIRGQSSLYVGIEPCVWGTLLSSRLFFCMKATAKLPPMLLLNLATFRTIDYALTTVLTVGADIPVEGGILAQILICDASGAGSPSSKIGFLIICVSLTSME